MSSIAYNPAEPPERRYALNELPIDQRRGRWGMYCVIATEGMLFMCMFGAYYFLGSDRDRWAEEMPPKLVYALILLVILLSSSVVLEWGKKRLEKGRTASARTALWATVAIGLAFLGMQAFEYYDHWKELAPYSDSYGSIFYAITSLHAAHVIFGLMLLSYVGVLPRYSDTARTPHRAYQAAAIYWHFVDAVWIFIVLLLYFIPTFQGLAHGHA
jgi:heme/copper-type cytochrome/quinol oxidase subunit 3